MPASLAGNDLAAYAFAQWQDPEAHERYLRFRSVRPFIRFSSSASEETGRTRAPTPEIPCEHCEDSALIASPGHPSPSPGCIEPLGMFQSQPDGNAMPDAGIPRGWISEFDERFQDFPVSGPLENGDEKCPLGDGSVTGDRRLISDCDNKYDIELDIYLQSTLFAGDVLSQQATNIYNAVHLSSSSAMLFTRLVLLSLMVICTFVVTCLSCVCLHSKPIAAMVSRRMFRFAFAFLFVYCAYRFSTAVSAIQGDGYFVSGIKRLQILKLRGSGPASHNNVTASGLLQDGCTTGRSYYITQHTDIIHLGNSSANGYYFASDGNSESKDPVCWIVESSMDNGSSWTPVGASVWRLASDGSMEVFPSLPFNSHRPTAATEAAHIGNASASDRALHTASSLPQAVPQENIDGVNIIVDSRPPLSWIISNVLEKLVFAVAFLAFVVAGSIGITQHVQLVWITLLLSDLSLIASGIVIISVSEPWMWREAYKDAFYVVGLGILAIASIIEEKRIVMHMLCYSTYTIISDSAAEIILYQREWLQVLLEQIPALPFASIVLGAGVIAFRQSALVRARHLVVEDSQRYEKSWAQIVSIPSESASIELVQEEIKLITSGLDPHSVLRQRQHELPGGRRLSKTINALSQASLCKFLRILPLTIASASDQPIKSLDQLYMQAWCLHPILLAKVKAWALDSGGCFPRIRLEGAGTQTFVRYQDVAQDPRVIRWASVKSVLRAQEKLVRVYGQVPFTVSRVGPFDFSDSWPSLLPPPPPPPPLLLCPPPLLPSAICDPHPPGHAAPAGRLSACGPCVGRAVKHSPQLTTLTMHISKQALQ